MSAVNLWDAADRFRPYIRDDHPEIDRPEMVTQNAVKLNTSLYPPCPLCSLDVMRCACDPDEYQAAALAVMRGRA
ncbi:hypothetical protein [Sphingomonas sp.]|uniref:hypothetical protein n=1 Tax=Sphingomonas sp. TaxID=28214 RepID=UPI002FDB80CF